MRFPFLSRKRITLPEPSQFPYVELRGKETRVMVLPHLGGKIAELHIAGRQWLWHNPEVPFPEQLDTDGSWIETGDCGGWDECFPVVGACRMPGWVRNWGGMELPDHGELWSRVPDVAIRADAAGQSVTCTWVGERIPWTFARTIRVETDDSVKVSYVVRSAAGEKVPFVWAAAPLFPLTPDSRVLLQEGARLRVFARHGIDLGEVRSEHAWPFVRGGGKANDFSAPAGVSRRYACKLFLDTDVGEAILRERDAELRMHWNAAEVSHVGVWINHRGWTPFRGESEYMNLGIHPGIGAPDTLPEALGDWKSAAWLSPGEERSWSIRLSGSRVAPTV